MKYNHYRENHKKRPDILPAEWVKYYGEEDVKIFERAYLIETEKVVSGDQPERAKFIFNP